MCLTNEFALFLTSGWQKKFVTNRGLLEDPAAQDGTLGKTAAQENERCETLFQRIISHLEDNFLQLERFP